MPVEQCICHKISFSKIKRIAEEKNLKTVEEIRELDIACKKCKLCEPYIKEMLKTGKTSFKPGFFLR